MLKRGRSARSEGDEEGGRRRHEGKAWEKIKGKGKGGIAGEVRKGKREVVKEKTQEEEAKRRKGGRRRKHEMEEKKSGRKEWRS